MTSRKHLSDLAEILARQQHREIIDKLDQDAKSFNVLLLKTDMAIPYTSVFLELDCGYWDSAKEARLRKAVGVEGN